MTTKFNTLALFFAVALMATVTSCKKDDKDEDPTAKPTITLTELGMNNSHTATIGGDLHVEAEIVAEGKIDNIMIEIHAENGSHDEIEKDYTSYAGLKNTEFHEHIDIDSTMSEGEYHFHMTVLDQEGNSTTVEAELDFIK